MFFPWKQLLCLHTLNTTLSSLCTNKRNSFFSLYPFSQLLLLFMGVLDIVPAGVVTGDNLRKLFQYGNKLVWFHRMASTLSLIHKSIFSSRAQICHPSHQLHFNKVRRRRRRERDKEKKCFHGGKRKKKTSSKERRHRDDVIADPAFFY